MIRRLQRWLAAAVAAVGIVLAAWVAGQRKGKQAARTEADRKQAQSYIDGRKRIDETDLGDDPDVLRDWLRDRDPNKR